MDLGHKKIIVLTPVKNEAWILERFLQVCSFFADHIIIADQLSTDGSLEIYKKYSKVKVIKNEKRVYNENERQLLLISTARRLYGLGNILLAIDADEILAANAMLTDDWQKMIEAPLGTVLYFEKPTFYKSTNTVIRYDGNGWPLGYVDDGAEHKPSPIHSTRIPTPSYAAKFYLKEIKFLHYALARLDAQFSKMRLYSMIENINCSKSLRVRRRDYNSKNDFKTEGDRHEISDSKWFAGWERRGVNMHTISGSDLYWYDVEALEMFKTYGVRRFYQDDIWEHDWEKMRVSLIKNGSKDLPNTPIVPPNIIYRFIIRLYFNFINRSIKDIKRIIKIIKR
ncbi:glycosyltransferase family 2 protein [Pontibacter toksunensis]|uniref:Glycosyltransferase family 2 protein n=1 Tax=Pontibacter toksunensis TaxID=1332631 RepID=A0ABW6BZY8_9BACT